MSDRIDIRDLALLLGPGKHDISGNRLIISDGAGREIEVELEECSLNIEDKGLEVVE